MSISDLIASEKTLYVRQRKELAELFGFETRNKYSIQSERGNELGVVLEQQKGVLGFIFRQTLGHWRTFELHFCSSDGAEEFTAHHPFRFFFQKLELSKKGQAVGNVERRWSLLRKSFDISSSDGQLLFTVRSPIWRFWTFAIERNGEEVAVIRKKWGGGIKEMFTDADSFQIEFYVNSLSVEQKLLIVTASVYVDLLFFESKSGGGFGFGSILRMVGL